MVLFRVILQGGRSLWQFYCRLIDPLWQNEANTRQDNLKTCCRLWINFSPYVWQGNSYPLCLHSAKHPVPDLLNEKKIFPRSHFWLWKTLQLFAKVNVFSHPIAPFPKAAFSYHRVGWSIGRSRFFLRVYLFSCKLSISYATSTKKSINNTL